VESRDAGLLLNLVVAVELVPKLLVAALIVLGMNKHPDFLSSRKTWHRQSRSLGGLSTGICSRWSTGIYRRTAWPLRLQPEKIRIASAEKHK
jgi:hypothetical protein